MYYHIWQERGARWEWIGAAPPGAQTTTASMLHYLHWHTLNQYWKRLEVMQLLQRNLERPSKWALRTQRKPSPKKTVLWNSCLLSLSEKATFCLYFFWWDTKYIHFLKPYTVPRHLCNICLRQLINFWWSAMGAVVSVWWVINYSANAIHGPPGAPSSTSRGRVISLQKWVINLEISLSKKNCQPARAKIGPNDIWYLPSHSKW